MTWVRFALSGPSLSTFTVRRIDLTLIVKPGIFIVDDVALPPPITFLVLPGEKAITAKLGGGGLDLASGGPSVGGREAQYSLQKYAPSPLYHASRWPFLIGNWLPQNLQRSRAITITCAINVGAWSLLWNKSPLHTVYERRRTATARHGPSACRYCRNHGQPSVNSGEV
jgi:hypothetical protein